MARLRLHNFTLSLDGYAAGPNQGVDQPLGESGLLLHDWIFETASFRYDDAKRSGEENQIDAGSAAAGGIRRLHWPRRYDQRGPSHRETRSGLTRDA